MKKPETALRRKIEKALLESFPKGLFLKIHISPFQPRGIPDILCCVRGRFIGLEVKRPGEEPTAYQSAMKVLIENAGGASYIVHSPEEAIRRIKTYLTWP
jgi:hypothetical protein